MSGLDIDRWEGAACGESISVNPRKKMVWMEPQPNLQTPPLPHLLSVAVSTVDMFTYPLRASCHLELVNPFWTMHKQPAFPGDDWLALA